MIYFIHLTYLLSHLELYWLITAFSVSKSGEDCLKRLSCGSIFTEYQNLLKKCFWFHTEDFVEKWAAHYMSSYIKTIMIPDVLLFSPPSPQVVQQNINSKSNLIVAVSHERARKITFKCLKISYSNKIRYYIVLSRRSNIASHKVNFGTRCREHQRKVILIVWFFINFP